MTSSPLTHKALTLLQEKVLLLLIEVKLLNFNLQEQMDNDSSKFQTAVAKTKIIMLPSFSNSNFYPLYRHIKR